MSYAVDSLARDPKQSTLVAHLLGATVTLAIPIALFASRGLTVLCALCAVVLALILGRNVVRYMLASRATLSNPVIFLLLYVVLSLTWTVDPLLNAFKVPQLIGTVAVGLVMLAGARSLDTAAANVFTKWLIVGLFCDIVILFFDRGTGLLTHGWIALKGKGLSLNGPINASQYKPAASLLAVLVWPAVAVLAQQRQRYQLLLALFFVWLLLVVLGSTTAMVCFPLGAVIFFLALRRLAIVVRCLIVVFSLMMVAMPFAPRLLPPIENFSDADVPQVNAPMLRDRLERFLVNKTAHRLFIWQFVAKNIMERPIFGWGYQSSRNIPGGSDERVIVLSGPAEPLPLHPHNGFLQFWLELGAVGAVLGALTVTYALLQAGRLQPLAGAAACASFGATIGPFSLSFGLWQSWWLSVLCLTIMALVAVSQLGENNLTKEKSIGDLRTFQ